MKSKKRHHTSSDETEESDASAKSSNSSSESDSGASSDSDHRHKKKKKRADSSESDSDSEDHKRKKRKHKKKKKKHGKKKRRSHSMESISVEEISLSDGEISSKKRHKHKHKHSKRAHSSSASEEEERDSHRLHSVVKERRPSSEGSQPSRPHYERRDYRKRESRSREPGYDREREVQRFYRGSSKDRSYHSERFSEYDRERNDKYTSYQDKSYKAKYQSGQYGNSKEEYNQNQRDYNTYKRTQKYEERKPTADYHGRSKEEYQARPDPRGYHNQNRYKQQYEDKASKRSDYVPREYSNRRPPPEPGSNRDRDYADKRERYQEDFSERTREPRRDNGVPRTEKAVHQHREYAREDRSRSPKDRYQDRSRRPEVKEERADDHYRDGRGDERKETKDVRRDPRDDRRVPRDDGYTKKLDPREDRSVPREDRREPREDRREPRDDRREPRVDRREPRDDRREPRDDRREPRDGREENRGRSRDERAEDRPALKEETKPRERKSRFDGGDSQEYSWGKTEVKKEGVAPGDKEKPNFGLSGKLTADVNTVNGVVIKYSEPDDAKQPKRRWRFYPFKGDKALPILYIHRQSAFLIGRDKKVVDICLEHPSVSKQHAALQYRATPFTRPDGTIGRRVRPYIIDLGFGPVCGPSSGRGRGLHIGVDDRSPACTARVLALKKAHILGRNLVGKPDYQSNKKSANGTFVNNKKIEARRYIELLERDVVKFGFSAREYVLLHENSKDDAQDDDTGLAPGVGPNVTTTDKIKQEKRAKQEVAEDGD